MNRIRQTVEVCNPKGVHGRVAARLAEAANRFPGSVRLEHGGTVADCSSILDVLSMALVQGTAVQVEVTGAGAEQTMRDIERILNSSSDPAP